MRKLRQGKGKQFAKVTQQVAELCEVQACLVPEAVLTPAPLYSASPGPLLCVKHAPPPGLRPETPFPVASVVDGVTAFLKMML